MKNTVKIISVILAALMIMAVVPFTALADGSDSDAGELVLSLDNLLDYTNGVSNGATYTPGSLVDTAYPGNSAYNEGEKLFVNATNSNSYCMSFGGVTNLPLNETSKYTITFKASLPAISANENNRIGFAFYTGATAYWSRYTNFFLIQNQTVLVNRYGGAYNNGVASGQKAHTTYDGSLMKAEEQNFSIVINEGNASLYLEDMELFSWKINEQYYDFDTETAGVQSYLTLGAHVQTYGSPNAANGLATMSDIKVYNNGDAIEFNTENESVMPVPTGLTSEDLVLSLDNLLDMTNSASDATYIPDTLVDKMRYVGLDVNTHNVGDKLFVGADTSSNNGCSIFGGITSLPLDENSQYTITFKSSFAGISKNVNSKIGFAFSTGSNGNFTSLGGRYTNFFTIQNKDVFVNRYGGTVNNGVVSGKTQHSEYVGSIAKVTEQNYTIIINGRYACLKLENMPLFSWEMNEEYYDFDTATDGVQSYLTLGAFVQDHSNPGAANGLATMSDIRVYDKVAADTYVVGVQNTYVANSGDTEQSLRFLAAIDTLDVSGAGFEISAKYMNGSKLETRSWEFVESKAYMSVKAGTAQGTVKDVTAKELGGKYLIATSISGIPVTAGQQIDFYIRSFAVIDGERVYSDEASISVVGGSFNTTVALLGAQ